MARSDLRRERQGGLPCPSPDHLPSCWRAGEIIEARCREAGVDAASARRVRGGAPELLRRGHRRPSRVPGVKAEVAGSGQGRDCFLPAFNTRPGGSSQYALSITNFEDHGNRNSSAFGFIGSSDNHSAAPHRSTRSSVATANTEAAGTPNEKWRARILGEPEAADPQSRAVDLVAARRGIGAVEADRQASFS